MYSVLIYLSKIIEYGYIFYIINHMLVQKYGSREKIIASFCLLELAYLLSGLVSFPMIGADIIVLLVLNSMVYVFYEGKIIKKLICVIFPYFIISSTEQVVTQVGKLLLYSASVNKSTNRLEIIIFFLVMQIFLYLAFLFCCFLYPKWKNIYKDTTKQYNHFISSMIVLFFSGIVAYHLYFVSSIRKIQLLYGIIVFAVIFILYTTIRILINKEIAQNLKELQVVQEQQKIYFQALQENIDNTRKFRHDLASHLNLLQILKEENQSDFFEHIQWKKESNYKVLSVLFDYYNDLANKHHIDMQIENILGEEISISEYDIVTICKNLLENAWEACLKDKETISKYINIRLEVKNTLLHITVRNSKDTNQKIEIEQGTTKTDKEQHGYGIKIIQEICQQYKGQMKYLVEDNYITVVIILKICEEGNKG